MNDDDSILLKFYVRPPSYSQLCRDQLAYIRQLEQKISLQDGELKGFRKNVSDVIKKQKKEAEKNSKGQPERENIERVKRLNITRS